jgi:hypothetical protein
VAGLRDTWCWRNVPDDEERHAEPYVNCASYLIVHFAISSTGHVLNDRSGRREKIWGSINQWYLGDLKQGWLLLGYI